MGLIKKGCGFLGSLVVLGLLALAGTFAYRAFVEPTQGYLEVLSAMVTLESEAVNQSVYHPPAGGELSAQQVERFVAVQNSMMEHLRSIGHSWAEGGELMQDGGGLQGLQALHMVLANSPETARSYLAIKEVQIAALAREGFSAGEYAWVRKRVWPALGIDEVTVAWREVLAFARQHSGGLRIDPLPLSNPLSELLREVVPEADRHAVSEHEDDLRKAIVLAALGL